MNPRSVALLVCAVSPFITGVLDAQSISISPGYLNVGVNQTVQYTATVTGLTNTTVTWEVSGVKGGNATLGTITQAGLYTAPATIPTASTLIEALGSDKKTAGAVYVNVEAAGPSITSVSPVVVSTGNFTLTLTGVGFKKGCYVQVAGANMTPVFVNSTTLTVSAYQGAAGSIPFMVQNPGHFGAPYFTCRSRRPVHLRRRPSRPLSPRSISARRSSSLPTTPLPGRRLQASWSTAFSPLRQLCLRRTS